MKIRTDFVTNSSSSSFILGFKNEDTIAKELVEDYQGVKFGDLYNDILNAAKMSEYEALDMYKSMAKWDVCYELKENYIKKTGCSYKEAYKYIDSEEGQKAIKEELEKEINKFKTRISDKNVLVEVEYGDGGYGDDGILEHEVVPNLRCCMAVFSNH